jgi:hypothetical protein
MSTPALTAYLTYGWERSDESKAPWEVGHFYRKFDGFPSTHVADLQRLTGRRKFGSLWELVRAVSQLDVTCQGANYNWSLMPVDPHTMDPLPEYTYYLSLVDRWGKIPQTYDGKYDVHLVVKLEDTVFYDGLLKDCDPDSFEEL